MAHYSLDDTKKGPCCESAATAAERATVLATIALVARTDPVPAESTRTHTGQALKHTVLRRAVWRLRLDYFSPSKADTTPVAEIDVDANTMGRTCQSWHRLEPENRRARNIQGLVFLQKARLSDAFCVVCVGRPVWSCAVSLAVRVRPPSLATSPLSARWLGLWPAAVVWVRPGGCLPWVLSPGGPS